ncbi:MAG: cyclic nucleotide-binding domain-containing protein [Deltaproteobacteria bacterium]|nr:cyclic nucleotide-binding domain-containing protein [Deltaproteobacteria bacterium]
MDARRAWLHRFLPRTPFFGGLNEDQLGRVMDRLVERRFAVGEEVFHEGDRGQAMYVIERGELVACQAKTNGCRVKLMRLLPGDFFGETSLIEMHPRPYSIEVQTEARVHELTGMDLYRLYKEDVKAYVLILQNINRELCRRLRQTTGRVIDLVDDDEDSEITQIGLHAVRSEPKC